MELVADRIAAALARHGVRFVATVPGGMIAPLLDAIHRDGRVPLVTFGSEQAAAFAVDAVGRLGGPPAAALATLGPGAINLLNGIAGAWLDSVPSVFLVGQVQSYLRVGAAPLRQRGFQEVDFASMVRPVCRALFQVGAPEQAEAAVDAAFAIARSGRPGPVVIELCFDLQASPASVGRTLDAAPTWVHALATPPPPRPPPAEVAELHHRLMSAVRPVIVAGAGARGAAAALEQVARRRGAPVCLTLHALDLLPADSPSNAGMLGVYGHRRANLTVMEADFVLVLGARLDHGQTSADVTSFRRRRTVSRVDLDAGELSDRIAGVDGLHADVGEVLESLLSIGVDGDGWLERLRVLREEHPLERELQGCKGINPHEVVCRVVDGAADDAAFVVDLGQHTWWASQAACLRRGQRFVAATGLGCMGYSMGACVGAALVGRPVVVFVGDAACLINLQELETLRRNDFDVLLVVLDNGVHGMVREFQVEAYAGRTPTTQLGYTSPPFADIAKAWGLPSRKVREPDALPAAVAWASSVRGPRLLHVSIDPDTPVRPAVEYGGSLRRMLAPLASTDRESG